MSMYSHMFLIKIDNCKYEVLPPNQLDWHFTVTKINDKIWHVHGVKEICEINNLYRWDENAWSCKPEVMYVDCSQE